MFVMASENICTLCLENCHTEYGKCVATNEEFCNVLCEKPVILVDLFLKLKIVVIQDSEDGKRSICKKCGRKIVNYYRMFTELREELTGGRALADKAKESTPHANSFNNSRVSRSGSILVQGPQSLIEVTPKAKRQNRALVKIKLKELSKDLQQRELCFLTNTLSLHKPDEHSHIKEFTMNRNTLIRFW